MGAALAYAAIGWRVFPCIVDTKRPCTANGFHDATTDADQIRAWWNRAPNANVAAACGSFVVLDVDVKPEKGKRGDRDLVELTRTHGPIGWTRQASTPNGGTHLFFRVPDGVRIPRTVSRFAPGIDVLGEGGYVVLPPSSVDGRSYRWINDGARISSPNGWVIERMLRGAPQPAVAAPPSIGGRWGTDTLARAARALDYVDRMPVAIAGAGGHAALWRVAVACVRGFELVDEVALEILRFYSERCEPPWSDRELRHKLTQARTAHVPCGYLTKRGR